MAKKDKKVSKIKIKKKNWYRILSPRVFGSKEIGETYLVSADKAIGRPLKVNLRELTGNMKDQNTYASFRINKVEGSVLQTKVIGLELTPASIKRMVRKNTTRLDDCFKLKTKDGQTVIIKPLSITQHKTQRSVRTMLQKQIRSFLQEELSKVTFETFVADLINRKMLLNLKKKLHVVFPLKEVNIRVLKLDEKKVLSKPTETVEMNEPETSIIEEVADEDQPEESVESFDEDEDEDSAEEVSA
ncbi:MAG: hypothetical protein Q8Q01_02190 [archaeon]|nr:hypothetical protein [archaeon]